MKAKIKFTYDVGPLKALRADLDANRRAFVKVGVLSNKAERFDINKTDQDDINNPTLGLVHEFGSASHNIPPRSFLRMPLGTQLPDKLSKIGKATWNALVEQKGVRGALEVLGIAGVQTVEEAFRSGGFGRWQPLKAATVARKGSSAILIDSGQLRRSISSAVVGGRAP